MKTKRTWSPEQHAKFRRSMRRVRAARKAARAAASSIPVSHDSQSHLPTLDPTLHFAHGYIRGWLEHFANSLGLSGRDFAERVGALLQAGQRRKARRSEH